MLVQPGRTVEGTHLWTHAENYVIVYWDVPSTEERAGKRSDDQLLDEQVQLQTAGSEVRRNERVEVGGFPGREFEFRYRNGGTITGRVVIADSRVYVFYAGGRFSRPNNENVRRFLDSFEITDPKLITEGKRRATRQLRAAVAAVVAVTLETVPGGPKHDQ